MGLTRKIEEIEKKKSLLLDHLLEELIDEKVALKAKLNELDKEQKLLERKKEFSIRQQQEIILKNSRND